MKRSVRPVVEEPRDMGCTMEWGSSPRSPCGKDEIGDAGGSARSDIYLAITSP